MVTLVFRDVGFAEDVMFVEKIPLGNLILGNLYP
jgi:hypothetical protein